jgi:transcriptional regulator of acetoin/glycerol metabolism
VEFLHHHPVQVPEAARRLPTLAEAERAHILRVLNARDWARDWNKKDAARVLDISRGTLYRKIVEYALEPEGQLSRNKTDVD